MQTIKRILALAMAVLCLAGCLSGCKAEETIITEAVPTYSTGAMGRYVEKQIPIPQGKYTLDMVMLSDGRLRIALSQEDGSAIICTMSGNSQAWEVQELPGDIRASGKVAALALSPDGTVFCNTAEGEEEQRLYHLWVIDPQGGVREIPDCYSEENPDRTYLIPWCDFTDSGILIAEFPDRVSQIDLDTGELGENLNTEEKTVMRIGCGGENIYMMGWDTVSAYIDGETAALDNAMGKQLADSQKANEGNTPKFTFWQSPDGYLFFTTHEGLFSYIPGGSLTEELVSGARSTLGDPSFVPTALAGTGEDGFYVLGSRSGGENLLLYYSYDAEVPTVADTQLKIFCLYEGEELAQMVSKYQVAHPEVDVTLEYGISGEDGITQSDAIRTLNTQILAGDGPDLVCLDGLNLNTYFEKGMLADLSGVLAQAEPTLTQVTECYRDGGTVYAVPTSFQLPVMYGPEHIVSQIHDWDSLGSACRQLRDERPDARSVLLAAQAVNTANLFYDVSCNSWLLPDGTVDEGALAAYYAGVKGVWDVDSKIQAENPEQVSEPLWYAPGQYLFLSGGSTSIIANNCCIGFGGLDGMYRWADDLAADSELENCVTAPLALCGDGVFIPKNVMGILSNSQHPQAAGDFLAFMLSQEAQAKSLVYGFPVNQAVFDQETSEDRVVDSFLGFDEMSFQARWPNAGEREMLRSWVANLTTPASTDYTARNMILDQALPCLTGQITPEEAAQNAMKSLNLYLAE